MAKKVSENEILNMSQDWAYDVSNGLPYSGRSIQKFIKENFESKMGYFHYDTSSNRYLCFADEDSKDQYVANPMMTELVLGSFDAPFNYDASITMLTPSYNAIFLGSTGHYLDFTFDIENKNGQSTGENVTVSYTFIRNANKKTITEVRKYGETVHFNIDEYLLEGTNTIIVGISGQNTFAATTSAVTYQVVNLIYTDEFDISKIYDLSQGSKTLEIFYNVSGYGTKVVEWFLDGQQLEFIKAEDEVVDIASQRTKYIEISNLNTGVHTLQSRVYTVINGEKFYTNILYREFIVNNGNSSDTFIALAVNMPNTHGIVTEENPLIYYGAEQYLSYDIRLTTSKTSNVSIKLGNELLTTLISTIGVETNYSVVSNIAGTLDLIFVINNAERIVPFVVNKTSLKIEEITTGLIFDFNAKGRSNTSVNRDEWSYNEYVGKLSGFKWNNLSGWANNSLIVDAGAEFGVNYRPLSKDVTSTGGTFEFEFSTNNVENDNAIICDLTTNGVGILITASEASITSAAGVSLSTKYKAGENHRISFVINRKSGVTYKGLAFIYVDGIMSGAVNYGAADNFVSDKTILFKGTTDAQISLKAMRFYNRVLSSNNMVNNFVLYRNTLAEMFEVYYRNQIYEEGSEKFSPENLAHYVPVMIITGDVPVLESATDTSVQILVDVEFVNEQDPTKDFIMKNVVLKIQGTSSLAYPRKNFRIYTRKEESSIVFDHLGNVIKDKLYSFKDGAQPVDCWNLKADYAESSGTHNTGIARLWNKVMYGAIIQHTNVLGETVNGYALRTKAQIAALSEGYTYDVRTTVDGFPIVLFYRQNPNDDLIFLGKYNFNNDKSTPSVFGFEGIPGFDNTRMQCWETKDNGHPLGLFTDISEFDEKWSEAFESRYPDTKTPNTADLKSFSKWINRVSQEDFIIQKWEHLDVYKVAAYYVYLMRFGAVDQPVKNTFITSEDGNKFYFINYDNDTINGLINTGRLVLEPTIDRDTIGSDGEYVYAGHDSVLWNKLTADTEFMEIVKIVDNALYSAGLRYEEVIKIFNEEQAAKWAEAICNQDAEYKYLLPYVNQGTNNLFMLQGSRTSHRSWWLSKRFDLYDSLYISGAYRNKNISFKCLNDTPAGQEFSIIAGSALGYGYGINNGLREVGIQLDKGGQHTFTTTDILNLGDVVKIFAAANIEILDLSKLADRLAVLDVSAATDSTLGTKMKKLILGGQGKINTELESVSGIKVLSKLQELNVEDYTNLTSLDLTAQNDFRKLYAKRSTISSITFASGAPVETLELPSTIFALNFNQLYNLKINGISFETNMSNIHTINIVGCPNLTNDITFVEKWLNEKITPDEGCTFIMDNINWENVDYNTLIRLSKIYNLSLKGYAKLTEASEEIVSAIIEAFGANVFNQDSEFFVDAPTSVFLIGPSEILEGENAQYNVVVFPTTLTGVVKWSLEGSRTDLTMTDGYVTTVENGYSDSSLKIGVIFIPYEGDSIIVKKDFIVRKRTYPTSSNMKISGPIRISDNGTYTLSVNGTYTGEYYTDWSLGGDIANSFNIKRQSDKECEIVGEAPALMLFGTISATIKKRYNDSTIATLTYDISAVNDNIAETDPVVCQIMHNAGLCANTNYLTKEEARFITNEDIATIFKGKDIVNFDGFQYFTSITEIPNSAFDLCSKLKTITLPPNVEIIKQYAFRNLYAIEKITFPDKIKTIESYAFHNQNLYTHNVIINITNISSWCNIDFTDITSNPVCMSGIANRVRLYVNDVKIEDLVIPEGVTKIKQYAFRNEFGFNSITIPDSVEIIERQGFFSQNNSIKTNIFGGKNVKTLGFMGFNPDNINNIEKGSNIVAVNNIPNYVGYWAYHNGSGQLMNFRTGCFVKGENSFEIEPNNKGVYFEGMATKKTIYLDWTGKVEDISGLLVNAYVTINIQSNKSEATFKITYTNTSNVIEEQSIGIGTHLLPIKFSTYVDITNEIEYQGYIFEPINSFIGGGTTSIICNYKEQVDIYIAHKDGTLYTSEEWTASGNSNDDAEGVCVMRVINGGFIIAKEDVGKYKWGGHNKNSSLNDYNAEEDVKKDFYGYKNTIKLIEELNGYTNSGITGAPAAEASHNYTFPSGGKGYLPALGELNIAYLHKTEINNSLKLIGNVFTEGHYWSSSEYNDISSWNINFVNGSSRDFKHKTYEHAVRPFGFCGLLIINSNIGSYFTLTYTNNQNKQVTKIVTQGYNFLNIKHNTTIKIISTLPYAEPQEFVWNGFVNEVSFVIEKDTGIYIQHIDGNLYNETEWTAGGYPNNYANGVAVISTDASFVISKENISTQLTMGGYGTVFNIDADKTDTKGYNNTLHIIDVCKGKTDRANILGAPAAEASRNYIFPNNNNGYIGAAGEWSLVIANETTINNLLLLIGGKVLTLSTWDGYWTSTQHDRISNYYYRPYASQIYSSDKSNTCYIRPFTTIYKQ